MSRMLALLAALPIAIAACNLMTGTEQPSNTMARKACLDDGTVQITGPSKSVSPGECKVTWDVQNVCSPFQPHVMFSEDNGITWQPCTGCKPNALRHFWKVMPEMVGKTVLLQVHVEYDDKELISPSIEVPIVPFHPERRSRGEYD